MAVIRKKNNTFGFSRSLGDFVIKSGNTSKSVRQILDDEEKSFSFFYDEDIYSKEGALQGDNDFVSFNDDNTIVFENKNVIPEYGIELKYFDIAVETLRNKLQFTPNQLATNFQTILSPAKREVYNKTLVPNYLEENSKENIFYKETPISEIISGNKNTIVFNFDLQTSCKLSFNKTSSNNETITFQTLSGNKTFKKHNGNIAYLYGSVLEKYSYNQNQGWGGFDYLGNIAAMYRDNITSFVTAPIAFNGPSLPQAPTMISSTLSMPIDTFFFPYASKFKAEKRHFIDISKYIKKSFVIEKVNIRAKVSNYSANKTSGQIALNFLNFFVLNQRGSLGDIASYEQAREVNYSSSEQDANSVSLQTLSTAPDLSSQPKYTSAGASDPVYGAIIDNESSLSTQEFVIDNLNNADIFNEERSQLNSVRELITYATLANFSANSSDLDNLENVIESLSQNSDFFINNSNIDIVDQTNHAECIYENRIVEMEVTPRIVNATKNLPHISNYAIFPEKSDNSSNSLGFRSNKFLDSSEVASDLGNFIIDTSVSQLAGRAIGLNENVYKETKYVIEPGDKIIVGVSLSPSYYIDTTGTDLRGLDVLELIDNVEVSFSGYYLENNKEKYYNTQRRNFKRNKRFGDVYNKVTDSLGSPNKTMQQGVYVDNYPLDDPPNVALAGSNILNTATQRYTLNSSIIKLPNDYTSQINNNVSNVSNNYFIYNDSDKRYPFHCFDLRNFGQFSNFIKYFKNAPYFNSETNKIEYALNKNLKRGFFINKTPATVIADIEFDFSSLENYNTPDSNWLKDNFFKLISINLFYQYVNISWGQINVAGFSITDYKNNKVNILIRDVEPIDTTRNYFLKSAGTIYGYDSQLRRLNYNVTNNENFVLLDIEENIIDSFNTDSNGNKQRNIQIDEFVTKISDFINSINNSELRSYDLDPLNEINSGFAYTQLLLNNSGEDNNEGFYDAQWVQLIDTSGNTRKFKFDLNTKVYTSESTQTIEDPDDPSGNTILVGLHLVILSNQPAKVPKEDQLISLKRAIELSPLEINAVLPYNNTDKLFIQQKVSGTDGNTTVTSFKDNKASFEISNFTNGGAETDKKFKLEVEAEILETTNQYKRTIRLKSKNPGKIDNLDLHSGTIDQASFANFYVSEGDVVNSYNIDKNARYSTGDISFEES